MFKELIDKRIDEHTQAAKKYLRITEIRESLKKDSSCMCHIKYSVSKPRNDDIRFVDAGMDVIEKVITDTADMTFVEALILIIDERCLKDSEVYKAAAIDRRLFSKMMSDVNYKPSKDTAIALAISLRLSLLETNKLLSRAGYTLSHSIKRDIIIEYFIENRVHSIVIINEVLHNLGEKILGR